MPDNGTHTTSNQYKRIQELVEGEDIFLVGIGNITTPWPIEGMPPEVDPEIEEQIEIVAYVPVLQVEAVIEVTVPTVSTITINDRYFQPIDASSLQLLRAAGTQLIYFRCAIFHKDITAATSYRSLGLYRAVQLDTDAVPDIAAVSVVQPAEVEEATLFYLRYVPPVAVMGVYIEEIVHFIVEAKI